MLVGGHVHGFPCQMRNLFRNSCTFEPAPALTPGDDGTLELAVSTVKLGFVVDDTLVEISIPHNIGLEAPVIRALDCIKEGSVARGWPLKGLVEPVG